MRGVAVATSLQGSASFLDQQSAAALLKWPGLFNNSRSSRALLLAVVKLLVVGLFRVSFGAVMPKIMSLRTARLGPLPALLGNFGGCGGLVSIRSKVLGDLLAH